MLQGTPQSYDTLADAKEAARQVVQAAIADAKDSLGNIRQIVVMKTSRLIMLIY